MLYGPDGPVRAESFEEPRPARRAPVPVHRVAGGRRGARSHGLRPPLHGAGREGHRAASRVGGGQPLRHRTPARARRRARRRHRTAATSASTASTSPTACGGAPRSWRPELGPRTELDVQPARAPRRSPRSGSRRSTASSAARPGQRHRLGAVPAGRDAASRHRRSSRVCGTWRTCASPSASSVTSWVLADGWAEPPEGGRRARRHHQADARRPTWRCRPLPDRRPWSGHRADTRGAARSPLRPGGQQGALRRAGRPVLRRHRDRRGQRLPRPARRRAPPRPFAPATWSRSRAGSPSPIRAAVAGTAAPRRRAQGGAQSGRTGQPPRARLARSPGGPAAGPATGSATEVRARRSGAPRCYAHLGIDPADPDRLAKLRELERRALGRAIRLPLGAVVRGGDTSRIPGTRAARRARRRRRPYAVVSDGVRFVTVQADVRTFARATARSLRSSGHRDGKWRARDPDIDRGR